MLYHREMRIWGLFAACASVVFATAIVAACGADRPPLATLDSTPAEGGSDNNADAASADSGLLLCVPLDAGRRDGDQMCTCSIQVGPCITFSCGLSVCGYFGTYYCVDAGTLVSAPDMPCALDAGSD
jgi:hypothetical protein